MSQEKQSYFSSRSSIVMVPGKGPRLSKQLSRALSMTKKQISSINHQQVYLEICKQIQAQENKFLVIPQQEGQNYCEIHSNRLRQEDLNPLQIFFIYSDMKALRLTYNSQYKQQETMTEEQKNQLEKIDQSNFSQIINIYKDNLSQNKILQLKIDNLHFNNSSMQTLEQGLKGNESLKELHINQCDMQDNQFLIVVKALSPHKSIVLVNFSQNHLTDNIGNSVQKMITTNNEVRNELQWLYAIRNDFPDEDISFKGLLNLDLSKNKLTSEFIKQIAFGLKHENWMKSLNLSHNQICIKGIKMIYKCLKENLSFIKIDVRENEGLVQRYAKKILNKLEYNYDQMQVKNHDKFIQKMHTINLDNQLNKVKKSIMTSDQSISTFKDENEIKKSKNSKSNFSNPIQSVSIEKNPPTRFSINNQISSMY